MKDIPDTDDDRVTLAMNRADRIRTINSRLSGVLTLRFVPEVILNYQGDLYGLLPVVMPCSFEYSGV